MSARTEPILSHQTHDAYFTGCNPNTEQRMSDSMEAPSFDHPTFGTDPVMQHHHHHHHPGMSSRTRSEGSFSTWETALPVQVSGTEMAMAGPYNAFQEDPPSDAVVVKLSTTHTATTESMDWSAGLWTDQRMQSIPQQQPPPPPLSYSVDSATSAEGMARVGPSLHPSGLYRAWPAAVMEGGAAGFDFVSFEGNFGF